MSEPLYEREGVWGAPLQPGQRWLARAVTDFWPAGAVTALDVGGGDGKLAAAIALGTGARVLSVDASLAAARRAGGALARASALPVGAAAVDVALCLDVLEHLAAPDEARAWAELFRVARAAVVVAVPFEEHLADGTAACARCGIDFHVNWHQRSYQAADLVTRVPAGWSVTALVVAGEAWPRVPPLETALRRALLGERAGWAEAVCPACGHPGPRASSPGPLPQPLAVALAERVYAAAARRTTSRAHSELLLVASRDGVGAAAPPPGARAARARAAALRVTAEEAAPDLVSCPQVARLVRGVDGVLIAQLPAYGAGAALVIERAPGRERLAAVQLEDGLGRLRLDLPPGRSRPALPRALRPGAFGVLLRFALRSGVELIELEHPSAPDVTWIEPEAPPVGYLRAGGGDPPVWVQATSRAWVGHDALEPLRPATVDPHEWRAVVLDALLLERARREALGAERDEARARLAALEAHLLRLGGVGRRLVRFLTRGADGTAGRHTGPGASPAPPPS